ncbi:MAG: hypothetical protein DWQ44_09715 [Bacteroidetes bacterium]|nr:MAG: hypothetical protein DWQ33_09990 [Bacteroidota bacterium]REK06560.1 MAG: hypothetical protein DWQ39_03505 [Bacteroidota bacterium]REK33326.1 MAG: hypothetical protein DWQ44_09715 [Bacteroidota bacterium]REK49726.1 MAG: hypothetical protein DWQ48_06270 [Bacteroidota bacterium]
MNICFKLLLTLPLIIFFKFSKSIEVDSSKAIVIAPTQFVLELNNKSKNYFDIPIKAIKPLNNSSIKDVILKITIDTLTFPDSKKLILFNDLIAIDSLEFILNDTISKFIRGYVLVDTTFYNNQNKLFKFTVKKHFTNSHSDEIQSTIIVQAISSTESPGTSENVSQTKSTSDQVSLAIGTNLDLADGADKLSFYGRISFFDPIVFDTISSLFKSKTWKPFKKIGIYGAVYQNRFTTLIQTTPEQEYYKVSAIYNNDSLRINRTFGSQKTTKRFDNYGLVMSLPITISVNLNSKPKHNRYFSVTPFDFEVLLRKAITEYSYTNSASDTIYINKTELNTKILALDQTTEDFVDKYWGFITFQYSMSGVNYKVFIKSTPLGMYWHDDKTTKYGFYSFYFQFTENNLGLRVGGEFKGVYAKAKPYFNLFITKSINLSKVGDALISKKD